MARTTFLPDAARAARPVAAARGGTLARTCDCGNHASGGMCAGCADEARKKKVSRFAERHAEGADAGRAASGSAVPSIVHDVLGGGGGQPLPGDVRAFMEPRFGTDFSDVRLHTDERAARSSRAVSAQAYTAGSHIVFDAGRYQPRSMAGQQLIAHELTHVVQQRGGSASAGSTASSPLATRPDAISQPGDASEREAETTAARVLANDTPVAAHGNGTPAFSAARAPASASAAARTGASTSAVARRVDITQPGAGIQRLSGGVAFLGLVGGLAALDLIAGALGAFDRDVYTTEELTAYLDRLAQRRSIEGNRNSDNKARDVVRHYRAGDAKFALDKGHRSAQGALGGVDLKRLLVQEMLDGRSGDDDQKAMLTLIQSVKGDDLLTLLDPAKGLSANQLSDKLKGDNHASFKAYLEAQFPAGSKPFEQISAKGACDALQAVMIFQARQLAAARLAHAIAAMDQPNDPGIRSAINCYFPYARGAQLDRIKAVLVNTQRELPARVIHCQPVTRPLGPGAPPATLGCGTGVAGSTWAHEKTGVAEPEMVLCPLFFESSPEQQAITIIHETAHGSGALEDVERKMDCGSIPLADALTNAESYAYLASALFTHAIPAAKAPAPVPPTGNAAPDAAKEPAL